MKKGFLIGLLLCVFAVHAAGAVSLYPVKSKPEPVPVKTERIHVVWGNMGSAEDRLTGLFEMAGVMENSDVYLYPIAGNLPVVKIETTEEGIKNTFASHGKNALNPNFEQVVHQALTDLSNAQGYETKKLLIYLSNRNEILKQVAPVMTPAPPETEEDGEEAPAQLEPVKSVDEQRIEVSEHLKQLMAQHPEITLLYHDKVSAFLLRNSGMQNIQEIDESITMMSFAMKQRGYTRMSGTYYDYDLQDGLVTIDPGKADANILVYASAEKADLLYIGGYMATTSAYEAAKEKSKIKGVSLSYHHMNFSRSVTPRNIAMALFTLDKNVVDIATQGFVVPVKNAEEVTLYYKVEPGSGVCTKDASYDKSQDDKVVNLYAPTPRPGTTKAPTSLLERLQGQEENTFWGTVKRIVGSVFTLIWGLLRLALFAFLIGLIFVKKFRSAMQIKVMDSRFGPTFEKAILWVKKTIRDMDTSTKAIRGNADLNQEFVFISHKSSDMLMPNNRIEQIIRMLEAKGIKCWLAEKSIQPGQNYAAVLPEAIRKCAMMVVFISPDAAMSQEVVTEVATAKENRKMIIPIQIADFDLFGKFPEWAYLLKQSQKTDLFSSKQEDMKNIANYIEKLLHGEKKAAPAGAKNGEK